MNKRVGTKGLEPSSPAPKAWCPVPLDDVPRIEVAGFEPAPPWFQTRCATRLRYTSWIPPALYSVFGHTPPVTLAHLECAVSRPGRDSSSLPGRSRRGPSQACARRLGGGSSPVLAAHRAARSRQNGRSKPVGPCLDTHRSVFRRPQLERYRVGSGSGRRRRRHTGSGRPARSWSCNVDPRMLRAVVITDALMSSMNLPASYAAVKHSFRFFKNFLAAHNRGSVGRAGSEQATPAANISSDEPPRTRVPCREKPAGRPPGR